MLTLVRSTAASFIIIESRAKDVLEDRAPCLQTFIARVAVHILEIEGVQIKENEPRCGRAHPRWDECVLLRDYYYRDGPIQDEMAAVHHQLRKEGIVLCLLDLPDNIIQDNEDIHVGCDSRVMRHPLHLLVHFIHLHLAAIRITDHRVRRPRTPLYPLVKAKFLEEIAHEKSAISIADHE